MNLEHQSFIICPHLIIQNKTKILLIKRSNSATFYPGYWHCVTGKMEQGETPKQTIIREAYEEAGLNINPELGTVISVKTKNLLNPKLISKDLSLFFVTKNLESDPLNKETMLHDEIAWFDFNALPQPMIPVVQFGIEHYFQGKSYGEFNGL